VRQWLCWQSSKSLAVDDELLESGLMQFCPQVVSVTAQPALQTTQPAHPGSEAQAVSCEQQLVVMHDAHVAFV